ncbi:hypothetical protein MOLA814_00701 [Betaproteobacteria bacterium MOLA814]|nr:hypothetical protein MOLA814_00701 [Betaproteobacteria bacterium MOLA814]
MTFLRTTKIVKIFQFKTLLALLVLLLIVALLTYIRVNSGYALQGDVGQLYLLLENIHSGNGPFNPWQPSLNDFIFYQRLVTLDAYKLCEMVLESADYKAVDYNHFRFHLYLILYPVSLFLYLFDAPYVAHGFNILSFVLFLFLSFKIARKSKIPVFMSMLAVIAISFHPAWSWSIVGQPYVDRMFLPLGLLLFYYTDNREKTFYPMLFVLAIAVLIVEKVILYSGIFLILYSILFYKDYYDKRDLVRRLLLGIAVLVIFFIVVKFYINNSYYTSSIPFSVEALINLFSNELFLNGTKSLLLVNAPLLLPALIFRPKIFLIAFIMLLPNILGNIGGAEKTNYYTHYHTLYFPFVVYAFIQGVGAFFKRISAIKAACAFSIYLVITASFYLLLGFDGKQNIQLVNSPTTNLYATFFYNISKNLSPYRNISTLIESNIPENAKISSIEAGWPYLYKFQKLVIYPLDFEKSDFLLVGYEKIGSQFYYSGYQGYLGPQHNRIVNDCLNTRISKDGYDVESPIILSPSLAVLKRKLLPQKQN